MKLIWLLLAHPHMSSEMHELKRSVQWPGTKRLAPSWPRQRSLGRPREGGLPAQKSSSHLLVTALAGERGWLRKCPSGAAHDFFLSILSHLCQSSRFPHWPFSPPLSCQGLQPVLYLPTIAPQSLKSLF